MFVLAAIYAAMNWLSYVRDSATTLPTTTTTTTHLTHLSQVALRRIDASAFTVCAQLKILSTAGFAVLILRRRLSWTKWRALLLIVFATVLVSSKSACTDDVLLERKLEDALQAADADGDLAGLTATVGYAAVLLEVTLSGFASIYFEKVIKATSEKL